MHYKRNLVPGGTYFFTVVTQNRAPILCENKNADLLREAFKKVLVKHPFQIDAFVLMPDHIHCIWTLPPDDADYSTRWRLIKSYFTRGIKSASREHGVWQKRYWEHTIRDEKDYENHCNYIHYNPVKHGLVKYPVEWDFSSFHRFVKQGKYSPEWCASDKSFEELEFGE